MTTASDMYAALMRPAVIQILRATGFSYAKPTLIDSLTDLAVRYLLLLISSTARNASRLHNDCVPTTQDVRIALTENGALRPQMTVTEEAARGMEEIDGELVPFEDLRGVKALVAWIQGPINKEIRRVAGLGDEIDVNEIAAGIDEMEDYLTAMKKKHSKTAEESRYQGTALGKPADIAPVTIAGSDMTSISDWVNRQAKTSATAPPQATLESNTPATSLLSSAISTPAGFGDTADQITSSSRAQTIGASPAEE